MILQELSLSFCLSILILQQHHQPPSIQAQTTGLKGMDLSFFCLPVRYLDCCAEEHNKSITWHWPGTVQCRPCTWHLPDVFPGVQKSGVNIVENVENNAKDEKETRIKNAKPVQPSLSNSLSQSPKSLSDQEEENWQQRKHRRIARRQEFIP